MKTLGLRGNALTVPVSGILKDPPGHARKKKRRPNQRKPCLVSCENTCLQRLRFEAYLRVNEGVTRMHQRLNKIYPETKLF